MNYLDKPETYFSGARVAFVNALPENPAARLLEIGAGSGATSAYALDQRKCGWCCGVELCEEPAAEAKQKLQRVIVGDVERLEWDFPKDYFDVLLMSEVLEHLVDPWALLRRLHPFLKPGAIVLAGSPNAAHFSVIGTLLRGNWRYEDHGIFDATHLRWFTPRTYRQLFESCNYVVDQVGPARQLNPKARMFNRLTAGRLEYLLHSQIVLRAHKPSNE